MQQVQVLIKFPAAKQQVLIMAVKAPIYTLPESEIDSYLANKTIFLSFLDNPNDSKWDHIIFSTCAMRSSYHIWTKEAFEHK